MTGTTGVNVLEGGAGNDPLTGGGGADILNGGDGSDTADYSGVKKGIKLILDRTGMGGDKYISIENLSGTSFGDKITGDNGDNVLTGQGGADVIIGGAGNDTLLGDFTYEKGIPLPGMGSGYATLDADASNNSIETALDISDNFSLAEDADIANSTTVLHTTVNTTGNGAGGYYGINLTAGMIVTIDIDGIPDPNVHDSWVRLLDSAGNIVAQNDDGGSDTGSTSTRDSGLVHTIEETGTYYILEGSWSGDAPGDGWEEAVPAGSDYKLNVSIDFPEPAVQPGEVGNDRLRGGAGNDLLDGSLGADTLSGEAGADSFRFSTELGDGNIDRIADFNVTDDLIVLDSFVFDNLGGGGALAGDAFFASTSGLAADTDDRIIYNSNSGGLFYDADGSGDDAAIQFAHISANLNLTAADFTIV
ncbi:calcium-binding protein [Paracoccus sp. JM45]|uniref:calcium-binding protein n=1 Tax=Paracoccus sp. JM45 TaxID=2283626 RepID=UPI00272C14C8|nr:calcium-binding protein [Paracoccus sp. JM45]